MAMCVRIIRYLPKQFPLQRMIAATWSRVGAILSKSCAVVISSYFERVA